MIVCNYWIRRNFETINQTNPVEKTEYIYIYVPIHFIKALIGSQSHIFVSGQSTVHSKGSCTITECFIERGNAFSM